MINYFRALISAGMLLVVIGFVAPALQPVYADGCTNLDKTIREYNVKEELPAMPKYCTVGILIQRILNIAFTLIGGIAVLFVIIGGYRYMTAGGNADAAKKGLQTALYAVLGLAVVILAVTAVNLVVNVVIYNKLF